MRILLILASLALAAPAAAGGLREQLVVSPGWLARHLRDPNLVILQVGDKTGYEVGHIPRSRLVSLADFSAPSTGPDALILEMPSPEALRARLIALGVSSRSQIIVVPTREGIQSATRIMAFHKGQLH